MALKRIHSFLVPPGKLVGDQIGNVPGPTIPGTRVPTSAPGKLVDMLKGIYETSDEQCTIDIAFRLSDDGAQENFCRTLLTTYMTQPSMANGRVIAERLMAATTRKSGLGLLFLLVGSETGGFTKLVVSRFRADTAIAADQVKESLSVQYLERVFMKKATSYKAVRYFDKSLQAGFWEGRAIDRQVNVGPDSISDYWIRDFLSSDFRTTSAQGTRRIADAIQKAVSKASNEEARSELIALAHLMRGMNGKMVSINHLMDQYTVGVEARGLIEAHVPQRLRDEQFKLSLDEFDRQLPRQSLVLDTGASVSGPTAKFGQLFKQEAIPGSNKVRISTEGRPVDQRLGKAKR